MKLVFTILLNFFVLNALCNKITILIDPGHGGKDPGHLPLKDTLMNEKDIALEIALKVGNYLTYNLSNVEVLYTRTTDIYPTLDERVDQANNNKVDYMLSVHVNGSPNSNIYGTETHIHNFDAKTSYKWARLIEEQFKTRAGRKSRGVKTAADIGHSIQVLKHTKMPTVLVECGFITNTSEGKYLNSVYGQEIIASAIFRATREFLKAKHPKIDFSPPQDQTNQPDEPHYKVQIMASIDKIDTEIKEFKKLDYSVERVFVESTSMYKYKYYVGPFSNKKDAKKAQKSVQSNGFNDAFVVYFE
ncbi:N-acetylmuramoyl-L-alanine amidase [Crocinitomix algicola]|uniref:N-acetylmuramoyl-L-alanine amidase n=1 Tax=Crocinitomix algicola TaxID=1740263 RepID=UPI000831AC7F|nr:N-acetylmuramoyl-L-alanine amidase [Crocinitomix algicola]